MKYFTLFASKNLRLFRNGLLAITFSLFSLSAFALSGTYTVGSGYDYTNLAAVATALNSSGVTGDCIFELQANYTEAPSASITFSAWTGNSTYKVTIRPAAGVSSMLLTAGDPGTSVPLIMLTGAQNMILDGRP